jgi:hypothetical protein
MGIEVTALTGIQANPLVAGLGVDSHVCALGIINP